jgi:hypothetical protein
MTKHVITFCFCLAASYGVAQEKDFGWLIGTWKLKDKNIYERWKRSDGGETLEGYSFKIREKDTIAMERIKFTHDANGFHYIADTGTQGPVDFTISHYDSKGFVAENPMHDFPKLIRYTIVSRGDQDFIEAAIEGNGKVIPYQYERVK